MSAVYFMKVRNLWLLMSARSFFGVKRCLEFVETFLFTELPLLRPPFKLFYVVMQVLTRYGLQKLFGPENANITNNETILYADLPSNMVLLLFLLLS